MDATNKVKSLVYAANALNEWDIISISSSGVHCREKFFVDHFEPESIEDTGKFITATAHVDEVAFFALFELDRGNLSDGYRKAAEKIRGWRHDRQTR